MHFIIIIIVTSKPQAGAYLSQYCAICACLHAQLAGCRSDSTVCSEVDLGRPLDGCFQSFDGPLITVRMVRASLR